MATKPVVLVLVSHYVPAFKAGGPVRSITNLVESLGDEFEFRILCADRDLGDGAPFPGIERDHWVPVGSAAVHYTSPGLQTLAGFAGIIREIPHDALYLNSFFSPRFTIIPLALRRLGLIPRRPVVIAPRGEFSRGALELKRAKKSAYVAIGKAAGLFAGLTWQASSQAEAVDIHATMGPLAGNIHVAMDLPAPLPTSPPVHAPRLAGAPLRVVFLSRISRMKNLDYALGVLERVSVPVVLSIYGPSEDAAYRAECEKLAASLPTHVSAVWRGPIEPAEVPNVLAAHDLFFLPTRGENYGHVIAEALGAGTPVLISDTTPWRDLARLGVGEDLSLARPEAFAAAIDRAAALTPPEVAERRACAFDHARLRQSRSTDIEDNRRLFRSTIERGTMS